MNKIKNILCAWLSLTIIMPVTAQKGIVAQLVREKSGLLSRQTINNRLLQPNLSFSRTTVEKTVSKASFFNYNSEEAALLLKQQPAVLSLTINNENGTPWVFDLVQADESFRDATVVTASGKEYPLSSFGAAFYRGVIRNQESESLVSVSIFNNEISGVISTKEGNFVLGKLNSNGEHILYNERNLAVKNPFSCFTPDAPLTREEKMLQAQDIIVPNFPVVSNNCVRLYYETEFDMFTGLGNNVANVVNYVTGLHNQVASIYLNEGIKTPVSQIRVWDVNDPYNGTNTATLLTEFQNNTNAINGNLGQLLTFRNVGGGRAAGFAGICAANVDNSLSVSGIFNTFNNVPVYSWSVYVVTHEFGHTFGSRHSHACVWNGNNTAIDGCGPTFGAQFQEGTCAIGPIPAGGGTIMSYCHLNNVGINFVNGFGPQPGDLIRNRVNNGACLAVCCQVNVLIFGNFNNALTESGNWIASAGATNIANGVRVTLDANPTGGHVQLNPGFEAVSGSVFIAQPFNGCTAGQPSIAQGPRVVQEEKAPAANPNVQGTDRLQLYPNPAHEIIYILPPQKAGKIITIEVSDAQGRRLQLNTPNNSRPQINISRLKPGHYFIKVVTQQGAHQATFIKQ